MSESPLDPRDELAETELDSTDAPATPEDAASAEPETVDAEAETIEDAADEVEDGDDEDAADEGAEEAGPADDAEPTDDAESADEAESTDEDEAADEDAEPVDTAAVDAVEAFKAELRAQDGDWYVIHSYAGYENRVKANLENRIVSLNMEEFIFQIEVPMEEVIEIKNGQRKQIRRVRVPGYVLVRMDLTDESWGAVRHTPGVTGFVGNAHNPVPLRQEEVFTMLAPVFEEQQAAAGTPVKSADGAKAIEVEFEIGESVNVKEGSFEGHPATITEIKPESQKLVVLLSIFERDVPVELGFNQVSKV